MTPRVANRRREAAAAADTGDQDHEAEQAAIEPAAEPKAKAKAETKATNGDDGRSEDLARAQEVPFDLLSGKPMVIGGESFLVGKLSLDAVAAIAQIAVKALQSMTGDSRQELEELRQAAKEGGIEALRSNISALLVLFDAETLNAVFGVVLDKGPEFARKHVDLMVAVQIVEAVLLVNDPGILRAIFFRLAKRFASSKSNSES